MESLQGKRMRCRDNAKEGNNPTRVCRRCRGLAAQGGSLTVRSSPAALFVGLFHANKFAEDEVIGVKVRVVFGDELRRVACRVTEHCRHWHRQLEVRAL